MLTTKRLVLRPYHDSDEDRMVELLTNALIKETFMIPDFASREEAAAMFKKLQQYSCSDEHYELGIYLQDELIGFVCDVDIETESIEVGYVIHPDFHNQGFATEALSAVIADLVQRGYRTVLAGAFETNLASRRVLEKCGMQRVAKEEDIFYHNRMQHCVFYTFTVPQLDDCLERMQDR